MANVIRIKRSTGSSAPTSLANAELAFAEGVAGGGVLYYGTGTGGAGGTATSIIKIGGPSAYTTLDTAQTISGNKTFTGTVDLSGATLSGNTTFSNNLTVTGDLVVHGSTTTVDSQTVNVLDKNITLGNVATPTNTTADGGGISLLGATTKTFNWVNATSAWTSSEHLDLASGKKLYINGTEVLSSTTLGSGVTGSSLTSVGTISTGTWQGSVIGATYGGTGVNNGSYTITLGGSVSTGGALTFSGAFGVTFTATATTSLTLPTSGTVLSDVSTIDGGTF